MNGELDQLADGDIVYKLVGPVLMPIDLQGTCNATCNATCSSMHLLCSSRVSPHSPYLAFMHECVLSVLLSPCVCFLLPPTLTLPSPLSSSSFTLDAQENVSKRVDFIEGEIKKLDGSIAAKQVRTCHLSHVTCHQSNAFI